MRIGVLTREWPDQVYGGAGVHVDQLVPHLRAVGLEVDVHCFGRPREDATAHASAIVTSVPSACSAPLAFLSSLGVG